MQIPPPSYVAQVWLASEDHLCVHFPQANDGHGHTVHLSGDVYGLTCMLQVLRERQKDGPYTVGTPSTPTQWEIDRAIRKIKLTTGEAPDTRKLTRKDRETLRAADEIDRRKARLERERADKHKNQIALLEELGLL